ncbi:MAG: threonylcarbamoyl-AMP synthase [Oscillospiraceae bacterium]|nr:threonylcarbamoyl-AMP synthase [Oscillospiraceae bacterium]
MKTELLAGDTRRAAEILRGGGVVAVPTETVYGLACNALSDSAVRCVYEVKGRSAVKPLSLLVPDADALGRYGTDVPSGAAALAEKFWPGPLTIVLRSRGLEAPVVRAGGETIGLRCPDHPLTCALLRACAFPLAAPSANPSGAPSPRTVSEVAAYFDGHIDAILDGGESELGLASTVLDMSCAPYRVLRGGALDAAEIAAVLRENLTVFGITGGSGSGKTTALHTLEEMGALVLDADAVYHTLTVQSVAMRTEIDARFGSVYDGNILNRKRLGALVFSDPAALAELNRITHKYVEHELEARLTDFAMRGGMIAAVDAISLLDIPLGGRTACNIAVTAPLEHRVARLTARDGITDEMARARIAAQRSDDYFETHCAYVLHNDGTQAAFEQKCKDFFTEVCKHGGTEKRK